VGLLTLLGLLVSAKFKQYLGRVKRSPRSLLSLLLVYLLWLSVVGAMSVVLRISGIVSGSGPRVFLENVTLILVTSVLAVGVFLGMKGGVTALPYEIYYVLTSNIRPIAFLLSDLVFQAIILSAFVLPPTSIVLAMLSYPYHVEYLVRGVPLYFAAIIFTILLGHLLGISRHWFGESRSRVLGWLMLVATFLPLLYLALGVETPPTLELHPSMILMRAVSGQHGELILIAPYYASLVVAYILVARGNFYPSVSPVLFTALMEPPRQFTKYFKTPQPIAKLFSINASGGRVSLMYRLHLTRVVREGTLWTGVLVLLFLTLANSAAPRLMRIGQFPEVAELTMIALYIPLLPALLSINWSLSERPNLWLVSLARGGEKNYIAGLFLAYLTVTFPFALILYGAVSLGAEEIPFLQIDLVLLFSMSCFGALLSILTATLLRLSSTPLSITALLFVVLPVAGSILLSLPILVVRLFEPLATDPSLPMMANMALYVGGLSLLLYKIVVRGCSGRLVPAA
jgi:hypothetical protein